MTHSPHYHQNGVDLGRETFTRGKRRLFIDGTQYASKSELACAMLLQKVHKQWVPIEGTTVHVPVAFKREVDIYIPDKDVVVEYHPIVLRNEFRNKTAGNLFLKSINRAGFKIANDIIDAVSAEFRYRYYNSRRHALDHSKLCSAHLIVCCTPEEFIEQVIKPLGGKRSESLAEWKRLISC